MWNNRGRERLVLDMGSIFYQAPGGLENGNKKLVVGHVAPGKPPVLREFFYSGPITPLKKK